MLTIIRAGRVNCGLPLMLPGSVQAVSYHLIRISTDAEINVEVKSVQLSVAMERCR